MRTPSAKAKSQNDLKKLISTTAKLWRKHHLTYDQARYVSKDVRKALHIERVKSRKRVYPHLLRHSVATTLLERGMPIDRIQKFLGHSKLETTQVHAESSTEMITESYRKALAE
jgi:site-specific recombinase XerD